MSNTAKLVWITPDAESLIAEIARVSNPKNQKNPKYAGLIKYLIENQHWSPFQMASLCVEIETSRRIAPQILRHASFGFQEFCLTGDSLITIIAPTGNPSYIPIKTLYDRQKWGQYKDLNLRVFDEKTKTFTVSKYKEIFYKGENPVFKITLSDGKSITSTKNHKFYTPDGFLTLEEITGLGLNVNNKAFMTKKGVIGVNGMPCYQNYEWLKNQREIKPIKSVQEIAETANTCQTIRTHKLKKANFTCTKCNSHKKLELDHIIAVADDKSLAYTIDNIQVLCHVKKHKLNNDYIKWRKNGTGNTLAPKWVSIEKIEYMGIQPTYDIEVEHPSHNYVANKIMVHNSTRYAAVEEFVKVNPRSQDLKNRQSSHDDLNWSTKKLFNFAQWVIETISFKFYKLFLKMGVAKESCAFLLPMSAKTKMYMAGTIRSYIHYINLRSSDGTQKEHREIALAIKDIFIEHLPNVSIALGWTK